MIGGSRPFYKAVANGDFDHNLDFAYSSLMAEGEVSQAAEIAGRAREIGIWSDKWEKRLARSRGLTQVLDANWLPTITVDPSIPARPHPSRVLSLFKASLPDSTSGYTIRTQRTLEAMQAGGYEVFPFTPTRVGGRESPTDEVGSVLYRRLNPEFENAAGDLVGQLELHAQSLYDAAKSIKPALVHAASGFIGPEMGLVALATANASQVPFVYELRGVLSETWGYKGERLQVHRQMSWLRWQQEVRLARDADSVVVIGDSIGRELARSGVDKKKLFTIPNGVDVDRFTPKQPPTALAHRLNPEGLPVVGYVSNVSPREGHTTLVRSVAELARRGTRVLCMIVGDGPAREDVRSVVRSEGIGNQVVMIGHVPHDIITDYYALIDVFVVPREDDRASRYTTPLKPYEAMAMEKPVVVSDLPALEEIIGQDQERGLTFSAGSSTSLADAIQRLLDDDTLAAELARRGRRWVVDNRKWGHNSARYQRAFEYALARASLG